MSGLMKLRVPPPRPEYIEFLSPYGPGITKLALAVRALVIAEAPEAAESIYDAYNAVTTGYSFTGRPGDAFIHIPVYARWVNLGFNWGADLDDPRKLLQGSGRRIRHLRIADLRDLEKPEVREFVKAAVARAIRPDGEKPSRESVVRAIYPRKRRPVKRQRESAR